MVVERQMATRQQKRTDFTRDEFIAKVWEWKEESGGEKKGLWGLIGVGENDGVLKGLWLTILLGLGIVVSSALYFADRRMKTTDNHFRGFPALWNAVAFYLFLLQPAPWIGSLIVLALIVLTFVPLRVIHPVRVTSLGAGYVMASLFPADAAI
eukprot:gene54230-74259_t